jgi:hypothetical protein
MKIEKSLLLSFLLLIVIGSLYRIMPGRPMGFAPQIAMAIFSGSIIKQKKYAFLMPLLSMLISDIIYEVLFSMNLSSIKGFYNGQWANYILFVAITIIGFAVNKSKWYSILGGSLAGVVFFFITSNFGVWAGGGLDIFNKPYEKTVEGLTRCYVAGWPGLLGSLFATLLFSTILFGGYYLFNKSRVEKPVIA